MNDTKLIKKKIHVVLAILDDFFDFPKGITKQKVKERLKVPSIAKLDHEGSIYLLRYLDNLCLLHNIDIDEL